MGLEFFGWTMLKHMRPTPIVLDKGIVTKPPKIVPVKESSFSPTTKERMRKNKSEENFVKFQVPWIL